MNIRELQARGWTLVDGIASVKEMLDLARTIGIPTLTPNGEYVKEVRRLSADEAPPGSQSSRYGVGPFPLHTDTVFWATPVRYLILRGYGDTRRATTVMSFEEMTRDCGTRFHLQLQTAVFRVTAGNTSLYCSLKFRQGDETGWRYDADLMTPANSAAHKVHAVLRDLVKRKDLDGIRWSGTNAAVLCNWTTLHGRAEQPPDEGVRVIERLYVR